MTQSETNYENLSERDKLHLTYVPEDLPLRDKLIIGRGRRMEDVISGIAVEIVDDRLVHMQSREYTQEEVAAIVSWAARAAVRGALDYDVWAAGLLPDLMRDQIENPFPDLEQ